jgi:hypothetical protein
MPVILATQEAGIRRITIQSQQNPISKNPTTKKKNWAGGVAQVESPEFNP